MHFYFVTIKLGPDCFCYDGKLKKKLWVGIKHFLFLFCFFPFFSPFFSLLSFFFSLQHFHGSVRYISLWPESELPRNKKSPFLTSVSCSTYFSKKKKRNRANVPPWCHTGLHAPLRTVTAAWRSFCPPRPRLDCLVFVPFPNMQFELLLLCHKASILPESKTEGFSKGGCTQRAQTFIRV